MDSKNSKIKRPKRQQKVIEDYWDCSVCTFRNTAEAFKCLMCDVRKGKIGFSLEFAMINLREVLSDKLQTKLRCIKEIP